MTPVGFGVLKSLHIGIVALVVLTAGCYQESAPTPDAHVPKTHAERLNKDAVEALQAGRKAEALRLIEDAVAADPAYAEAHCNKGTILGRLGRYEEALASVEEAIVVRPHFATAHLFRGIFLEKLGREIEAMESYANAVRFFDAELARQPDAPKIALNRAIAVYLQSGKVGGLSAFNALLAKYPNYRPARFLKERILAGDRDYFLWWVADRDDNESVPESGEKDKEE